MAALILQKGDLSTNDFANNNTNNAGGISIKTGSGSAVGTAIAAAVAALPTDKYVSSMAGYNAATNVATFNLSDGTTTTADFSGLVADAVASAAADALTNATVTLLANNGTTVLGHLYP